MGFKTNMVWFWMIWGTPTLGSYLAATAMPVPSQSNFFGESPHGLGTPGSCWAVASCHAVLGGGTTGPTNGEKWGHNKLSTSWMAGWCQDSSQNIQKQFPGTLRTEACSGDLGIPARWMHRHHKVMARDLLWHAAPAAAMAWQQLTDGISAEPTICGSFWPPIDGNIGEDIWLGLHMGLYGFATLVFCADSSCGIDLQESLVESSWRD